MFWQEISFSTLGMINIVGSLALTYLGWCLFDKWLRLQYYKGTAGKTSVYKHVTYFCHSCLTAATPGGAIIGIVHVLIHYCVWRRIKKRRDQEMLQKIFDVLAR